MKSFCRKSVFQFFNLILLSLLCFTAQATINLGIELNPDPVQPGETVSVAITVSNSGVASTGSLSLKLRYPENLNDLSNSFISDGGTCPSFCRSSDFLTWTLGNLAPGASVTVTLPPVVWSGTPDGTLISFDAALREDNGSRRRTTKAILVSEFDYPDPPVPPSPPAATLVTPNGTISDTTPTYTWNAVSNSSWYQLWVNDSTGNVIRKWYTAAQANCASGTGTCSITPTTVLTSGNAIWWIQTWNSTSTGPWSTRLNFNVGSKPPAATLISPNGAFGDTTPTYTWNAVPSSTWYYLWVNDSTGNIIKKWYTAAQASCASGTGTCTITSTTVVNGNSRWWIQTWNPAGSGPWSSSLSFITPPARTSLVSPSGSISDTTPTYTWNAVADSTWYYLWVNDSTGNVIRKWYTAAQSGCATGTGTCSITSATALANGNSKWWIKTWNPGGSGPWSLSKSFAVN